ncbi:MAG: NIPSNAP family protein, partial [Candidatus Rokuibacteriota bacterium]
DLNERAAARAKMAQEPEWQAFLGKSAGLLANMQAIVLNPASFSPMR